MSEKLREELLPCPFCGSEAVITQTESAGGNGRMIWIVGCYSEDCDVRFPGHARQIDAKTAWNKRRFQADTRAGMAAYRTLQQLCENDEERECLASKNSDGLFSDFLLTRLKGDAQPKVKCRECGHRFHENECQTSTVSFNPQKSTSCECRGYAALSEAPSPWVEIKSEGLPKVDGLYVVRGNFSVGAYLLEFPCRYVSKWEETVSAYIPTPIPEYKEPK